MPYTLRSAFLSKPRGGSAVWRTTALTPFFATPFFGVPTGTPVPLVFRSYLWNSFVDAISSTFTGMAIGTAASDRWVVAAVLINHNTSRSVASVTIGGVSAVELYEAPTLTGNGITMSFWKANVPSGTTANVVVTANAGTWFDGAVALYTCTGEPTLFASAHDNTYTGTTFDVTVNVPYGGAVIGLVRNDGAGALSGWTGATPDQTDETNRVYVASANSLAGQTSRPVSFTTTATSSNAGFFGLAVVSLAIPTTTGGGGAQTLSPTLVDEGDTFFAASVTRGAVALAPALLADADTFFAPTVVPGAVTLAPSLLVDGDSFFGATVTPGAVAISPPLLSDGDTFYAATIVQAGAGTQTLLPSLVDEGDTFFAATVVRGTVSLAPALVSDPDTFFAATITRGAVTLAPSLVSDADAFFAATIAAGAVNLTAPLLTDADTFFAPTVVRGAVALQPPLVDGGDAFFAATIVPGAVVLAAPLFADADAFYPPTITVVVPAPIAPERIAVLAEGARLVTVPALSDRVAAAVQDGRSVAVPAQDRTYVVEALNRVVFATEEA